jgi:hypothetical protein
VNASTAVQRSMLDEFWRFVELRQDMFTQRMSGSPPPWTTDATLAKKRFTNVYRVADRVSQRLVRDALYTGDQDPSEIVFRSLLFRIFNTESAWDALCEGIGDVPSLYAFDLRAYGHILSRAVVAGRQIWSAAYMVCGVPVFGVEVGREKHMTYLTLLSRMLDARVPDRVATSTTPQAAHKILRSFPLVEDFLALQFTTDISYSTAVPWDDNQFVVLGPGSTRGLRKLGMPVSPLSLEVLRDMQDDHLPSTFQWLGGSRRLSLMDIQNCACEFSKVTKEWRPEAGEGIDKPGSRIKQNYYLARAEPLPALFLPPKWGLNGQN